MGQVYDLDLPGNEQAVLLSLADHANHDGGNIFPSNGLTAWKLGVSEDTVSRLKKKLVARGILVVESEEPGRVKCYRIDLSKGERKPDFVSTRDGNSRPTPPQFATPRNLPPPAQPCGDTPPQTTANPPAQLCGTNQREPSRKPSKAKSSKLPPIPASLGTPEFLTAWGEWLEDRKARNKPVTPLAASKQLAKLEAWGVEKACAAIDMAIEKGWQGLFEPKGFKPSGATAATTINPFADFTQ